MSVEAIRENAFRLYRLNWIALGVLALFDGVFNPIVGFSLELDREAWAGLSFSAALVASGHFLLRRNYSRLAFVALSVAQLGFLGLLAAMLTYIAASVNLPLQDEMLDRWDKMLGMDWAAYYKFMVSRPELLPYFYLAYLALALPPFGVPIVLGLTKNYVRLQRFTLATFLTIFVVAFLSALMPAIGTYQMYGLPTEFAGFKASGYLIQLERLPGIRSGDLHIFNISQIGGVVTFPSFHAAAAGLALWAWWGVWWMRPWAFMMSAMMLIATPLVGGHYFVDVFAGLAIASLAIILVSSITTQPFSVPSKARALSPITSA
ncbi:phosphatase PAP2 family protein [Bradyrhizobium sp. CCBAU 51627]|uniref:phosphatase PAP2 family protein n=1 Tax=Bradyrhizobium sp. CCBAU 51627 TaxID=1325088 RepID=UPI00230652FE|nr:phosphatase PAP2 family protein [Bradyrhizobium sp. CCBAU 51627]